MNTVGLTYDQLPSAMPSNTRVVILTGNIPGMIFQPIHKEIRRRHLNYLVRQTPGALDQELKSWLAKRTEPPVAELPPPPETPQPEPAPPPPLNLDSPVNASSVGDELLASSEPQPAAAQPTTDMALKNAERGSLRKFVQHYANLRHEGPIKVEAQRLFAIAREEGLKTTTGSLEQAVRVLKKEQGIALNRPGSQRSARPQPPPPEPKKRMVTRQPRQTKVRDGSLVA